LAQPGARAKWIGLLARAPIELLDAALGTEPQREVAWLRAPETGLMMVEGRVSGNGSRFNVGEVTVTRCALKYESTCKNPSKSGETFVGVAYVLGRSHLKARLAALADALLQDPVHGVILAKTLLEPLRQQLESDAKTRQTKTQQSKVEFFTVAREAGSPAALAEEES
jgi:alpha-D-ribose 1-methylphosphonate 5-triphosphate synthase subunit PhnG